VKPALSNTRSKFFFVPANLFLGLLIVVAGLRVMVPSAKQAELESLVGQEVVVGGKLYDDPDRTADNLYKIRFKTDGRVNVFATLRVREIDGVLERGDTIVLRGKLNAGFGAFAGSIYRGEVVSYSKSNPPDRLLEIRNWFSNLLERHIPEPESALALGYLLGQKRALPAALLNVLAITGLTHIVVASGANLTIITRMMRRLFGKSRWRALVVALLAVGMMVGMIGFAPSLVRAGLVSVLALLAWYFGRPVHPVRLILLAAATTLIIDPSFILDVGWQLSFAAFGGVLLFAPVLTRFFYGEEKAKTLPQIAIETLGATILTLPILLYHFGYFSLLSLVANLLILPTIPLAMLLSFMAGGLAFLPPLAMLAGVLATWVLRYHIAVMEFFGEMEFAIVEVSWAGWQMALAYAVILVIWLAMKFGTRTRLLEVNIIE